MITTRHSLDRAKERMNLNKDSATKNIRQALLVGTRAEQLPSNERNFLSSKEVQGKKAIYYNGFCYIFSLEDICITLFRVPGWFLKKCNFDGKIKVKNPKKYFLKYNSFSEPVWEGIA